jgi:hypothetical protein
MEMFLTVMALSLASVLVSGVLFVIATREREEALAPVLGAVTADDEERFFIWQPVSDRPFRSEAIALQIERHVRLERAAAEAFLQLPTVEALRVRTLSPLAR